MGDNQKAKDLREQTVEELETFVSDKVKELFRLRFQHFTGQLENTAQIKLVRREVARARTIVTERAQAQGVES
ncbi:MAG: 50S ribosomal protein L29 [Myxococcales bacterium]|nr:50S ribosomal protein L29 [Myxococcales bacterium]